ncbi:hypothetical protein [Ferviditalea candida]|uniref:TrbL/VirB6 plasmid conjugal transfer protein n=1 Tax=Ferviditalea candida TaxID=3108399 RepID=A0ABU5ZKU0_9BACL|nr:hypothetical protein [Paenibacillaceae bacterium T2]
MRRRCRYGFIFIAILAYFTALVGPVAVYAETPKDMLDQLLPGESEMGIEPGDRTLDYRQYPTDHYTWDLGYDLVEWSGWKPKMNNPFPIVLNWIANVLFMLSALIVRVCIFLMRLGFHTDLVNEQLSLILPMMDGLRTSIFSRFLPWALVLLTAWMVKVGYWNNQTTRLMSGVIGSIVVLIGSYWFFTHSGQSIRAVSQTMDKMTQVTMGSLAAPYQRVTGEQLDAGLANAADQQLMATSNRLWKLFVDRPWLIGQFNRQDGSAVRMTSEEVEAILDRAEEEDVAIGARVGDAWSHWMRQYAPGMKERDILRKVLGDPKIDHGDHADIPYLFAGGSAGIRCLVALLSLIATLMLLLFVGTISLILILAQEMALAIIILAPIVLLLGLFPERGVVFVRRWVGWLVGTLGAKVIYGFYLGFTLLVADIVARGSGILMLQQIFVALLFFCAFLFRKKILKQLLGIFQAPTPHEMYDASKREVAYHVAEAKQSWETTKERAKKAKTTAKKIIGKLK